MDDQDVAEPPGGSLRQAGSSSCDGEPAVTRSLLEYGVIAGPFYLVTSVVQALTRTGFDLTRHDWSLLANGTHGWIQIANLVATGAMTVAAGIGFRRSGLRRAGVLLAGYGVGLVGAGVFVADPADGFPVGTPAGRPDSISWHGLLHFVSGGIGFLCLIAACLFVARSLRGTRQALFARITGLVFLAAYVGIASGSTSSAVVLAFTAAVALWAVWMSVISAHLYRITVPTREET